MRIDKSQVKFEGNFHKLRDRKERQFKMKTLFNFGVIVLYIEITIDLKNYQGDCFDLRLSNYYTVKEVVDIVWQAKSISLEPKEGFWVRVQNKKIVLSGNDKLESSGVISGDCLEIL